MDFQENILNLIPASFLSHDQRIHAVFENALAQDQADAKLSSKFRLYYRFRWMIPIFVRQMLQRSRNTNFQLPDDWFIPQQWMQQLASVVAEEPVEILHPWPDRKPFAFVLTHDVETKYGLDLIEKMASIEEKHGFRSVWNLIPKKYKVDDGLLQDLHSRGFEFGVHGYNHDGRLFESERKFFARADFINQSANRFQAAGFRAPMVHRDLNLIVEHLEFDYDASCFDIDPFQAMPGGVGSIWPFLLDDNYVEIPYTMPQDHTLFVSLAQSDTQIWKRKADFLRRNSGMVLLLTHPDYMDSPARLDLYDRFLGEIAEAGEGWHALPAQVAAWWIERESAVREFEKNKKTMQRPDSPSGKFAISSMSAEGDEVRIKPVTTL